MGKIIYCVLLLIFAGISCGKGYDEDDLYPDLWSSEYDNLYDYDFLKDEDKRLETLLKSNENIPVSDEETDKKVEEENETENAAKEEFDTINDYQFEDNRQKSQEQKSTEDVNNGKYEEKMDTMSKSTENNEKETQNAESIETNVAEDTDTIEVGASKETDTNADYALLWGDSETTPLLPVPIVEDENNIFDGTHDVWNKTNEKDDGFDDEKEDNILAVEEPNNLEEIIDETKKILADSENNFDDEITLEGNDKDTAQEVSSKEEASQIIDKELYSDLERLIETFNKLSEDESEETKENHIKGQHSLNAMDHEEKYSELNSAESSLSQSMEQNQDYELIDDSNLSEIFSETSKAIDQTVEDSGEESEDNKNNDLDTERNLDDDSKARTENEQLLEKTTTVKPIIYENDAIVDELQRADSSEVEEFDIRGNSSENETSTQETDEDYIDKIVMNTRESQENQEQEIKKKMVDDLTSAELDDLIEQFSIVHSEDLDTHSETFSKDVAPIHITLSVDEPVVVTSPNYPNPYPANNIIDWIFEGEGMGIELNITDFAVNGALGDYVLFKPGGIDETGHSGLVFSYRLTSERRYRFTDVDKMFVRFEAKPTMFLFLRGFKFSVRMISPLPEPLEDVPEAEPVLTLPAEILTVHLGGVNWPKFQDMKEDFRELVADMATQYIKEYNIDPGMNHTIEITQLLSTTLCNINWPSFDNCTEVSFGVPLTYEEGMEYRLTTRDLEIMWREYLTRDPFALRLRRMGITEFAVPDDSSILMVWLVVAAGVIISVTMLAFALWRYSCFEDYSRMPAYSDTDSLKNEKRGLDLYPTPHQILPPLYAENDYKWADDTTRVDMGGFANKSYVREDLYDFDSEEEVVQNRDRFTTDV